MQGLIGLGLGLGLALGSGLGLGSMHDSFIMVEHDCIWLPGLHYTIQNGV